MDLKIKYISIDTAYAITYLCFGSGIAGGALCLLKTASHLFCVNFAFFGIFFYYDNFYCIQIKIQVVRGDFLNLFQR